MLLSYGIMCALWARERTGKGQKVETSLLQAALAMQLNDLILVENDSSGDEDYGGPTYGVFRCGDDAYINVGALQADQFARLCTLLDLEHLAHDPRFTDPAQSAAFRADVFPIIEELFTYKPSREWLKLLDEVDVPCAPVLERRQVFDEPQMLENEMIVPLSIRRSAPRASSACPCASPTPPAPSALPRPCSASTPPRSSPPSATRPPTSPPSAPKPSSERPAHTAPRPPRRSWRRSGPRGSGPSGSGQSTAQETPWDCGRPARPAAAASALTSGEICAPRSGQPMKS